MNTPSAVKLLCKLKAGLANRVCRPVSPTSCKVVWLGSASYPPRFNEDPSGCRSSSGGKKDDHSLLTLWCYSWVRRVTARQGGVVEWEGRCSLGEGRWRLGGREVFGLFHCILKMKGHSDNDQEVLYSLSLPKLLPLFSADSQRKPINFY